MNKHRNSSRKKGKKGATLNVVRVLEALQTALLGTLAFVLPLVFDMDNTSYNRTKVAVFLAVTATVLALWGMQVGIQRRARLHVPLLFWPGLAWLLAGALSLLNASSPGTVLQALWLTGSFFLLYVYLSNTLDGGRKLRFFLLAGLLSTVLAGGYGLLQYGGLVPGHPDYLQGQGNIISSFGNRNFLAEYLNVWLVISPALLLLFRAGWVRAVVLACAGLACVMLLLVNSIGALLGALGGLSVLAVLVLAQRCSRVVLKPQAPWLLGWLGTLLVGVVLVWLPGPLHVENVLRTPALDEATPATRTDAAPLSEPIQRAGLLEDVLALWLANSGDVRVLDWAVGLEMFKAHPLFGVGLNHYGIQFLNYKAAALASLGEGALSTHVRRTDAAHNDYVQNAAELGAAGTLALLALLGVFVVGTWRRWGHPCAPLKRVLIAAATAGVVTLLLDALVNFPLHLPVSVFALVLLTGVLHAQTLTATPNAKTAPSRAALGLGVVLVLFGVSTLVVGYRDWQADRHLNTGNRYLLAGHYQLAQREYQQSLSLALQPAEVLFRLGGAYYQLDDRQQAKAYFERALPHYLTEESLWNLSVVAFQDGAYEQSLRYVERLLATDPQPEMLEQALALRERLQERLPR